MSRYVLNILFRKLFVALMHLNNVKCICYLDSRVCECCVEQLCSGGSGLIILTGFRQVDNAFS